jgi:hypothetical protein
MDTRAAKSDNGHSRLPAKRSRAGVVRRWQDPASRAATAWASPSGPHEVLARSPYRSVYCMAAGCMTVFSVPFGYDVRT